MDILARSVSSRRSIALHSCTTLTCLMPGDGSTACLGTALSQARCCFGCSTCQSGWTSWSSYAFLSSPSLWCVSWRHVTRSIHLESRMLSRKTAFLLSKVVRLSYICLPSNSWVESKLFFTLNELTWLLVYPAVSKYLHHWIIFGHFCHHLSN